ncbi:MAG: pantetheine-phosphate adenylyltransferase [Chloroflexi bacterium]|nr:pantetheine-phosphate adenylyltransferase [Chloroflexota bacterium]MDA1003093.1 pantetheine-phosphate adenylyltransferase [Chloroflexota bacterium]MQC27721.1 pantetheine-phosphate adenylyltransferase [Chloroflexota bacterium]
MTVAMYPGRFDPATNGHLDIVTRAAAVFDQVIVAVAASSSSLFTTEERTDLFREAVKHLDNVSVITFSGLTVDAARAHGANALVRGLRAVTDFHVEFDMALMNRKMAGDIESVFMMTAAEHLFISATRIRELAGFGRDVKDLVPLAVNEALLKKFADRH